MVVLVEGVRRVGPRTDWGWAEPGGVDLMAEIHSRHKDHQKMTQHHMGWKIGQEPQELHCYSHSLPEGRHRTWMTGRRRQVAGPSEVGRRIRHIHWPSAGDS